MTKVMGKMMNENQISLSEELISALAYGDLLSQIKAMIITNEDHDGELQRLYEQLIKEQAFMKRSVLLEKIKNAIQKKYDELKKQEMQYQEQVHDHLDQLNRLIILLAYVLAQQGQEKRDYDIQVLPPEPPKPPKP